MVNYYYSKGQIINGLRIIEQISMQTKKGKEKGYLVQSTMYPDAPFYEIKEGNLKNGKGDAYASGRRVYEGNSLYSHEEFRKFIVNNDKAKTVTRNSPKFLDFMCPECKRIKSMRVYHLVNNGFSCPVCSTGISYPERFMLHYLQVKSIPHEYQVKLTNSSRRVDFKVSIDGIDYMLETHGRAHYDETLDWYKDTVKSDVFKRHYCKENKIPLLELDCRESDFNYIKRQINSNTVLPSISNIEEKEISQLLSSSKKYPTNLIIEDNKKGLNLKQISDKYNLTPRIVQGILNKSGVRISGNKKKTLCVTTGVEYNSTQEASKLTGISQSGISNCCNGKRKTAGGMQWKYI
ncbi:helix-turn-helix DNA binding protein [Staphylococcus phage Metroid]|nr:helix-turn-helix DNA binding protein [Staphylococcus phage Metroid]